MNTDLLTLAIHTPAKAKILKTILENNGMTVYLEQVGDDDTSASDSLYIKIDRKDLLRALSVIEANKLFSYADKETYKIDDGRRRILVAIDFSDYSKKACQVAFDIAKEVKAKVKILHIYSNLYFPTRIPFADALKEDTDISMLDKVRKQMLDFCLEIDNKIINKEWPSVNYSYSIREGIVEEEIDNFVDEYKPALLVLGTKGKGNTQNFMLGSVTADVIEMTNVPVLAVPENSPINSFSDVKRIAFLTNMQTRDLSSFESLISLLGLFPNIKMTLVHINRINSKGDKWNETQLEEIKENFLRLHPQMNIDYKIIDSPDIPKAVNDFAQEEKITVICINTRRRNIFGRMFAPSISRKVLFTSNTSLLVLRG